MSTPPTSAPEVPQEDLGTAFLTHLADAVRIPTVGGRDTRDDKAFAEFRRFVSSTYPTLWEHCAPEMVNEHSLVFTWRGTDTSLDPVLFMGHIDVVPVETSSEDQWAWPPFSGEQSETHIHGRGVLDDKGSVVAILEAVQDLYRSGFRPRRTLHLAFGHDEESSGREGAAAISALFRHRDVHLSFVLDEGGYVTEGLVPMAKRPVALIGIAEKGYLDLELTASAEPGHSALPSSSTAIGLLAASIAAVESTPMEARPEVQRDFFRASARAAGFLSRIALRLAPRFGRIVARRLSATPTTNALIRTTITPTIVEGGTTANVIPGRARAVFNARILPGDTTGDVLSHVERLVDGLATVRPMDGFEPSPVSSIDSPEYQVLADVVRRVHPEAVVAPWLVVGATDSRYYSRIADQVFRFNPFRVDADEVKGFHGPDERIRLADAQRAVMFYRLLAERLCS